MAENKTHTTMNSLSAEINNGKSLNASTTEESRYFEHNCLSNKEISFFTKDMENLTGIDSTFKEAINMIGNAFTQSLKNASIEELNIPLNKILIENFFYTAKSLAICLEAKDPYTGGHSDRVFQVSKEIGKRCNLNPKEQLYLEGGSLLHDIGKISIRDAVLLKPGPLTDLEFKEMQLHPILGAKIIDKLNVLSGCMDAVLYHHERIDGYGYPYGLKGSEIPITARITSVTDAYDAMTTNRVYRRALSHKQAIEEVLRNSGTQFDPEIVKVFVSWWEENLQYSSSPGKNIYKDFLFKPAES